MINPDAPEPFEIQWYECIANNEDAAYSKTKAAKLGGVKEVKAGDVMWRALQCIGPFAPDHDHWAGTHLGIGGEIEKAAHLMAASPVLTHVLKRIIAERAPLSNSLFEAVNSAIKLAETGETT